MPSPPFLEANAHFLDLPRELRDKVYDHLLSGLKYHICSGSHVFTLEYEFITTDQAFTKIKNYTLDEPKTFDISGPSPRWLLACSQMLSEGLAQFARKAKCTNVIHHGEYKYTEQSKVKLLQDALLLPRLRQLYVVVALVSCSNGYPQGPSAALKFQVRNPNLPVDTEPALGYRHLLPQVRRLHVEINTLLLTVFDGREICLPDYERLSKEICYFPGSMYEEVHFNIRLPSLPARTHCAGAALREPVALLPAMARMLPKLQASLVELGKQLTGNFAFPGSQQADEEKYWMMRDWIDMSTYNWHMMIRRKSSGPSSLPDALEHDGLQHFKAPKLVRDPAIVGRYAGDIIFARDKDCKAGNVSWSCNDTGETIWLQDGPEGSQSGYMRANAEWMEQRYSLVFEELRCQWQMIAPVTEGMGKNTA